MSHFTVGVITKDKERLEDLLAPYSESLKVAPYVIETKEEIISNARAMYDTLISILPERIENEKAEGKDTTKTEEAYANALKKKELSDEDIYKDSIDEDDYLDVKGNRLSTYNPNSKWDWYEIGGRWSQSLLVKDTVEDYIYEPPFSMFASKEERPAPEGYKWVDGAKIKDIEFDKMAELSNAYAAAIRFWEIAVEGSPLQDGEEKPFILYKGEYYIERYGTKENYAKRKSMFSTYALLIEGQGWIGQGDMGWWVCDNATKDSIEAFFEKLEQTLNDPDYQESYFIVVDCHI